MEYLLPVPSPNHWLIQAAQRRNISHNRLARLLGVDESRFGRWVTDREQIPRSHLAELARQLPPADISYLLRLKDCEDLADYLQRKAQRLAGQLGLGSFPSQALFQCITDLVAQERCPSPLRHTDAVVRHLVDAAYAVQMVQQMVGHQDYRRPFLSAETVARFRYPVNHFIGTLFDLDTRIPAHSREARAVAEFRDGALQNVRAIVRARSSPHPIHELSREFSMHVLARHGTASDREFVQGFVQPTAATADPLLRRLSFTGLLLGGRDAQTVDRFVWSLQREAPLRTVNLLFNAFHYGDLTLEAHDQLLRDTQPLGRAIPHVLRHLEQSEQYAGILDAEALTFVHLLDTLGPAPFRQPAILSRLRTLLREDSPWRTQVQRGIGRQLARHLSQLGAASR